MLSPVNPSTLVTAYVPSEFLVTVQTAGVVVEISTGSSEVALALNCTVAPNGALTAGENEIAWAALDPGCGVVMPVTATEVVTVTPTAELVPSNFTEIVQVPFQSARTFARVCTVSEPTYSTVPITQTFGVDEAIVRGVVPVMDSLRRMPARSLTTTLNVVPLTVGAADQVLFRATIGRFHTIVLIFEIAAQRSSPA